ncbi:MAG: NADPH:quinone oxidoreductase family protein [Actinobacteria bacterium]|nr:NADPH:quinone oxidoreductase family protein [Actinomycetota bacterium]
MVRRVVCQQWAEPELLEVVEEERRPLGADQVRVAVEAAGVNFVDALFVAGTYQIKVPPPFTPGSELAGTVTEVGTDVHGIAVGDRVISSLGLGAWSDEVIIPAAGSTPVPEGLGTAVAAALVQSYCTAWFTLTRRTRVEPGEVVLVLGAAGGVGLAAIDVARALGATVIAAASTPAKLADATRQGATATIAYTDEDLKTRARELGGGGVDVVVDPVGGPHTEAALRALRQGGRLAVIGFAAGPIPTLPANQVLLNNRTVVGVDWGAWAMQHPDEQRALLDEVLAEVVAGRLHPPEPQRRPLDEAGTVLRELLDRKVRGKVVLVPGPASDGSR